MNKQIAIATLLAILTLMTVYFQKSNQSDQFDQWKQQFGQQFNPTEQSYRKMIFQRNLKLIKAHNSDPTQTYKMGVNQFTIYTEEQFKERFLSQIIIPKQEKQELSDIQIINEQINEKLGDTDWTTNGKVTRIKNQGNCGSCWAFSAVASTQSWALIKNSTNTLDLSEQQLVDCSGSYGNIGCNGGWPAWALQFIQKNGITSEVAYPYVAKFQSCKMPGGSFKITGVTTVSNNCGALISALVKAPIAVTVDATNWSKYSSGVFNNCQTSLNHAVLLVGFVSGDWKIKNSWGASWGQSGYMRIAPNNTCGICQAGGSYPTI